MKSNLPDIINEDSIDSVRLAREKIFSGGMVILTDDEDRENEGDLVMAAEDATPERINFMVTEARGLICVPMLAKNIVRLELPMQAQKNTGPHYTAFSVSVDAAQQISTGISASDRALTIKLLANPSSKPSQFVQPGHVFPLKYHPGGVLVRAGHTEGSIDLIKLANKNPAAIVCEILNDDGTMARGNQLEKLSNKHDIPIVSIADIISYRMTHETLVKRVAETVIPTKYGKFNLFAYKSDVDPDEHIALTIGKINEKKTTLVRVESECLTGHVFNSRRCDCGEQVDISMKKIAENKNGVLVYMRQEGRGIGLLNKLKAYKLQDEGMDTVQANESLGFPIDLRHYGIGAQILRDLGVGKFDLLTNNPKKVSGLSGFGLEMNSQIPFESTINEDNRVYLKTKSEKMGHSIKID